MSGTDSESRFDGAGQEFHAKYMGCVEVAKSKGQEVCQEAMQKLLTQLKGRKEPKPRMIVNLSYEGTHLKEMPPGINLLDLAFKHSQVSYVWKDPRDQRSLGIVRSEPDPEDATKVVHKFHGIRTVKPAMPFLQEMQELFRIVKERAAQHREERAASVAAETAAAAASASVPAGTANQQQEQKSADDANRDRAVSNLLGPDQPAGQGGRLPKNESVASLDELGDIFSASATIGQQQQQLPTSQPMGGGGSPFGQPMGGGQFGQPMGGGQFGQPMGGGQFGQPMGGGGSPFGQPMGGGQFGQPMGGGQFGQPMRGGGGHFGHQPMPATNPFGPPVSAAAPGTNPFGGGGGGSPQPMMMGAAYGMPPTSVYGGGYPGPRNTAPYSQQQQQQQFANSGATNPFFSGGGGGGGGGIFDRQSSTGGQAGDDLLVPVSLNPAAANSSGKADAAALKPDAFSDLMVGLTAGSSGVKADPKRQQVSSKDLFKAADSKPKASLRDLANQSPRPGP